jgi:hypothetical protein
MVTTRSGAYPWLEISRSMIEPTLSALRLWNTAFDGLFYDVGRMVSDLFLHGQIIVKGATVSLSPRFSEMTKGFSQLDLSASSNPAGSILVVDAGRPPRILQFENVANFINWVDAHGQTLRTASVTGVGSSALGSAAFAWNVSTALGEPVAAIVPGYGAADAVQQGLDGCFEVFNLWLGQISQKVLANTMPRAVRSDRRQIMKTPGHARVNTGASTLLDSNGHSLPTFCAQSSNVLHAILNDVPAINRVFGHSKGGVAIRNAIQSLPPGMTQRLHVVTFGWSMPEDIPTAGYSQFLGRGDGLGLANSWGSPPPTLIPTHHGTNTNIPFSIPVSVLTRLAMIEQGVAANCNPVPAARGAGATTTSQPGRVVHQRNEEDSKALLPQIQNDEDAHDNAAD